MFSSPFNPFSLPEMFGNFPQRMFKYHITLQEGSLLKPLYGGGVSPNHHIMFIVAKNA